MGSGRMCGGKSWIAEVDRFNIREFNKWQNKKKLREM